MQIVREPPADIGSVLLRGQEDAIAVQAIDVESTRPLVDRETMAQLIGSVRTTLIGRSAPTGHRVI